MKNECNKYYYVKVCVLKICMLLFFVGCHSPQDLNDDTTNNSTISTTNEGAVSDNSEIEREIKEFLEKSEEVKNKYEKEKKKRIELEHAEIQKLLEKYKEFTIKEITETGRMFETGNLSYTQAKKEIEQIVHVASHWNYVEPDDTSPKGMCLIVVKSISASSGIIYDTPPTVALYRDEMLAPVMGFSKHEIITSNGKPIIQIQSGSQPPENVIYENLKGRPFLRLTEKQYSDVLNSEHDIKLFIINDNNTIISHIASGNIKECADQIEHRKLNNWEYKEETDAFDNVTYRFCTSVSPNKVYAKLKLDLDRDNKEAPVMVIRQKNHNTPEIILNSRGIQWPSYWNHNIRIKFNDEKPISNSYTMGAGSITTIFLNSEKKLLQRLFTAKRVTFQMPDSKETFSYDLSELPETCAGLELSGIVK